MKPKPLSYKLSKKALESVTSNTTSESGIYAQVTKGNRSKSMVMIT